MEKSSKMIFVVMMEFNNLNLRSTVTKFCVRTTL